MEHASRTASGDNTVKMTLPPARSYSTSLGMLTIWGIAFSPMGRRIATTRQTAW
jgi:hypothetical protein